jgi:hypothetical protein
MYGADSAFFIPSWFRRGFPRGVFTLGIRPWTPDFYTEGIDAGSVLRPFLFSFFMPFSTGV